VSKAQKSIRVVHVLHSFSTGGLEKGVATLVCNGSPWIEHIILCLSVSGDSERMLPSEKRVVELHKREGNSCVFLWRLSRALKSLGANVVHTRSWGGIDGIIAARLAGIHSVVHGEHGWGMVDPNGLHPKRVYIRRFVSRWVREYTCVSKQIESWLRDDIGIKKRVTQIYNGVDTEKYSPGGDRTRIRQALGLAVNSPVLGVVARLDSIKDHPTLFSAFETVRKKHPEVQLVVVGEGPDRKRLESIAGKGVVFLGNRTDVEIILKALDVFVLTSLNEGISNTILEAMGTGLPVVATHVGGNPELVEHGQTGFLVKPGDSQALSSVLLWYLECHDLLIQHGKAGRKKVIDRFSIQAMVRAYEEVYERVAYEA
jgi:sugar transferase (PEP-CTERM/EpsH1 system associated)